MNYLKQILTGFKVQSTQRKLSLLAGVALIATLTGTLLFWALSPTFGVLFNDLDSRDASHLVNQLEQANIAYRLQKQGTEILIDKQLIDKTRIKLMGSDLSLTHSVGFELFDKTDFGMTDFSQKINYQRALQGELERTINSLDEVKQARVHLVIPESHLFQQESNLPRVAVTLHLNHPLNPQQVKSIQQLITASVANLPATNVVIVDQNGNSLTASEEETSTNHFTAKKEVERYLNEKVMQMLSRVFTDENVVVKIDATLNYDQLQRELVKPRSDGLITHEKETQHSTTGNKADKKPINNDFTREKSYEFGREKERFTRAGGTIQRLTISVVVPRNTAKEQINQVERLVKSVIGFDAKRGDTISVEALIVESQTPEPVQALVSQTATWPTPLIYLSASVVLFLLLVGLLLRFRRRARQRRYLLQELSEWLIEHG